MILIGGPLFGSHSDPGEWADRVREHGYRAAYCPVSPDAGSSVIADYAEAASRSGIVIAEVGAWSNPLSPDRETREDALRKCKDSLQLAESIGARCCVNIAGSRGKKWDGPCRDDLHESTFDRIVESVRRIIDAVNPTRTFYTIECMPWMFPDSPDAYLRLIGAIDRKAFGVHLDPVNLVNSPRRYFDNALLLEECVAKLGPHIRSCHAKDIMGERLTLHLDETQPGLGELDYATYLHELSKLPHDVPLMLEHLPSEQEYRLAAEHIRSIAASERIEL